MSSPVSADELTGEVPFGADTGVLEGFLQGLEQPPAMTPTEWAAEYWAFSGDVSAEAGKFNPRRAAYQPGMLDAIIEPGVKKITMKTSAQVGKTTTLMITLAYCADRLPGPMMLVQPTREVAEGFSKETLAAAIRDVPKLGKIFPDAKSRDGDNTIFHKKFPGGFLALAGANSPIQLRRRAIKFAFADEVDAWENNATKEGDPIGLLEARQKTFWDRRFLQASTPLKKHKSRISRGYEESDQRKFMVPCPECSTFQVLEWKLPPAGAERGLRPVNIHWTKGKPETAEYECCACHALLSDLQIKQAVRLGHWKAHAEFRGHAGFWIWELYSPWSSLHAIVAEFEAAEKHPDRLEKFVNTTLGLEWEGEVIGSVEVAHLLLRREKFDPYVVPAQAALLTAGVDLQHDRIEIMVQAWGLHEERWILSHEQLIGNPDGPEVWMRLQDRLLRSYKHALGHHEMQISCAAIDSGGWHTQKAYDFCGRWLAAGKTWLAIKGDDGFGRPVWKRSKVQIKNSIPLIIVGVDTCKLAFYTALRVPHPGPSYIHLPWAFGPDRDPGRDEQGNEDNAIVTASLERLTVEKLITEADPQGFPTQKWHIPEGARNEELDCAAYNIAAFTFLNCDTGTMTKRLEYLAKPKKPKLDAEAIARMFAQ